MKQILTALFLLIGISAIAQTVKKGVKATPAFTPASVQAFNDSIAKKQNILDLTNSKTINGTPVYGAGNISIAPSLAPENDYYVSVYGNNANSGASLLFPKNTLVSGDTLINASTLPDVKIGLEGGSTFRGTEGLFAKRGHVTIQAYNRDNAGKFHFPTLLGTNVYNTGWSLTGSNTYQQTVTNSIRNSIGNYAYIYVIEIDTLLEKVDFWAARKYLRYVLSVAAVDTTVGSYYCPVQEPPQTTTLISIHTSDNTSPNNNSKFRYEVVVRDQAASRDNTVGSYGDAFTIKQLIGLDWASGAGLFASRRDSFYASQCVWGSGSIHELVCGNYSTIDKCAFFQGDPYIPQQVAVVFYQIQGAHETNTISNSYFLDQSSVLYTHTSGEGPGFINHGRLNFWNNYVLNCSNGLKAARTLDTLDMNFCYFKDAELGLIYNEAGITWVKNSVFENTTSLSFHSTNLFIENTFYRSKRIPSTAIVMSASHKTDIQHSIFHIKTDTLSGSEGGNVLDNSDTSTFVNAKYNIFIMDIKAGGSGVWQTFNNYGGLGQSKNKSDYNVYIKVGAGTPLWKLKDASVNGGDPSVRTLALLQTLTGQETHSIYIDLSIQEGNLKRVFVNPEALDYILTNSPQADSIRAIIDNRGNTPSYAGMRTPLSKGIAKQSRSGLVDIIENDRIPLVSSLMTSQGAISNFLQNNQTIVEKMTKTQRDAIVSPTYGRIIFQTDNTPGLRIYLGAAGWNKFTMSTD